MAASGVIVSESPAGVPTEKWRFPVRNRLLAALSDVVVVVESRHHGGSRHTVDAAVDRGVPVGAVPGSIRSATSEGTNALLADGAFPVCSTGDILVALALLGAAVVSRRRPPCRDCRRPPRRRPPRRRPPRVRTASSTTPSAADPASLDELARIDRACRWPSSVAASSGSPGPGLARDAGGWWERA